ncbi:MAG: hypothetical protein ABR593_08210, partial [Candidatus Limnocylindria bacterium]
EEARHRARLEHGLAERERAEATILGLRSQAAEAAGLYDRATRYAAESLITLEATAAQRDAAQELADATRQAVIELTEALQAARAELAAIAEPHGAAARLGRRLTAAGWPTLLDSIAAPEASWPAIEAVVGGELESALLWTDGDPTTEMDDARGAARLLATDDGPPIEGRDEAMAAVRGDRTLADWIGLSGASPRAFARTVLAPDLTALLVGWRHLPAGWAAVTAQGDVADRAGIVIRGRGDPPGGREARAHARGGELGEAVAALEVRFADAQERAHAASEALIAARNEHLLAREAHDEAERVARVARESRAAGDASVEREQGRLGRLTEDVAALEAEVTPDGPPTADLPDDAVAARQAIAAEARAYRDRAASHRDRARDAWTATRHEAEEIERRTAGWRGERAELEARVAQLRAAIPDRRRAREAIADERSTLSGQLDAARSGLATAEAAHRAADEVRSARRAELISLEREQGKAGAPLAELEQAAHAAVVEASRRDEALAGLLRERDLALEGLPESTGEGDALIGEIEALDDAQLEAEGRRVRRTLSQIGSVNPFALEEHRELADRLDEMTAQDTDLRAAIAATEELMATLDGEIAAQFDTAFRAIGERFDEYCRLLFAGGSGSLQMGDDADGDAPGGIEIVVRPPGKRLQRLAMLSGGERALTGVALLFAMLTVNPVPFCILDEVDAALDEANIGRFAEALRRLSESIDFVVITHNRATIEVADTIYGVTMSDAAVSRVLSLRLADVPAEVSA